MFDFLLIPQNASHIGLILHSSLLCILSFQECPPDATDFRAQQCAAYNDVQYRDSRFHEWEPVDNLPRPSMCTLTCRAKGHNIVQVFSPKVLDGTRCSRNSRDMCINGKCEVSSVAILFSASVVKFILPQRLTTRHP